MERRYGLTRLKNAKEEVGCSGERAKEDQGKDSVQDIGNNRTKAVRGKTSKANAGWDGHIYHWIGGLGRGNTQETQEDRSEGSEKEAACSKEVSKKQQKKSEL